MLRRGLVVAVVMGFSGPGGLAEEAEPQAQAPLPEALTRLDLTASQARQLLPIVEKAAQARVLAYQEHARLLPDLLQALEAFAEEDRANEGFTPQVERRLSRLHQKEKEIKETLARQLIRLEHQASRVLTAEQLGILESQDRPVQPAPRPSGRARRGVVEDPETAAARAELEMAQWELRRLHELREPQPGLVARYLLAPAACEALCQLAQRRASLVIQEAIRVERDGTDEFPRQQYEEQRKRADELRAEINNWNLINALNLDRLQIEAIVGLYDAAHTPAESRVPGRLSPQMLRSLEEAVEQVLNPGQLEVLAEYKPCLIPPKNLKDPVRAGQAADDSQYERWLSRARKADAGELKRFIDSLLEREAQRFGELSPEARRQRAGLLRQTVRKAARMSDAEFEVNKPELAAAITPPDRTRQLQRRVDELSRACGRPGRIARFILNAQFIEQLRQRDKQLAAGSPGVPADPSKGPQADSCDRGCALPGRHPGGKRK